MEFFFASYKYREHIQNVRAHTGRENRENHPPPPPKKKEKCLKNTKTKMPSKFLQPKSIFVLTNRYLVACEEKENIRNLRKGKREKN